MEFHVSREVRSKFGVDDVLFNFAGNAIFGNLAASREFARKANVAAKADAAEPTQPLHAAALFAMGLIDELSHALIARYRETLDPGVLSAALDFLKQREPDPSMVDHLLLSFTDQFPNTAIFRGKITAPDWLAATTPAEEAGTKQPMPNREAALEELLLLWLANINPAFAPFKELFDDKSLARDTIYKHATADFEPFFATRPLIAPEVGTLLDALRAPMLASPDSLSGQLAYMRDKWSEHLGPEFKEALRRTLLAISTLKDEEIAIWTTFNPPTGHHRHGHHGDGWGAEGFEGDEFIGFGSAAARARAIARGEAPEQPLPLNEYEAFSPDQAWMPTVVLIAKSTYVWLEQLSKKYQRHIHRLDQIPDEELALLADRGINGLWLIGLWERSSASQTIKRLRGQADAVASAYSLKDYRIAEDLGGTPAYEHLRDRARLQGIRLASDMVPNHMGIDSTWVMEHPEWFLSRPDSPFPVYSFDGPDLSTEPRFEIKIEDHYYEQTDAAVVFRLRERSNGHIQYVFHGNDGTTFAWNDTAQLDYSKGFVREQVIQTILSVAKLFPIIRFDAAMTLAKKHVQRLWFPLPGIGGCIPSRAENAMSQAEFDALMPNEFWREVVDRVAEEVPGTLLLAEAFWLLEGYFVRTLGMHRVYNSAFMNMLRDEENAKYRSYLQKTIEFDPDILKRYVNFMSNPDERTAIDQFGTGDKYFGTSTLLATLPGLPMFGHGQIEGFTEKYGMEYKQARFNEWPNDDLVARHQREIAPLLKNRALFAESANFVFYDLWTPEGTIDENVFAYSNRLDTPAKGTQPASTARALILYNNAYSSTRGTIHISTESMNKFTGNMHRRSLKEALDLPYGDDQFLAWRDTASDLEYLRRANDFDHHGFSIDLRGYQYTVLQHWRELRATADKPWDKLCDALNGAGVYNLDESLSKLRLRPLHEALRQALTPEILATFTEAAAHPHLPAVLPAASSPSAATHSIQAPIASLKQPSASRANDSEAIIPESVTPQSLIEDLKEEMRGDREASLEAIPTQVPVKIPSQSAGPNHPAQNGASSNGLKPSPLPGAVSAALASGKSPEATAAALPPVPAAELSTPTPAQELKASSTPESATAPKLTTEAPPALADPRLKRFLNRAQSFLDLAKAEQPAPNPESVTSEKSAPGTQASISHPSASLASNQTHPEPTVTPNLPLPAAAHAATLLPSLEPHFAHPWPSTARIILPVEASDPAIHPTIPPPHLWAPIVAWLLLDHLTPAAETAAQFDELHLRAALAETFTSLGVEAEQAWRLAARVRALLAFRDESTQASDQFWDDPDISWLLCKSESNGIIYINQQCFEELLWWLQLPNLLAAADPIDPATLQQREAHVATLTAAAKAAGYDLTKLRAALTPKPEPEEVEATAPEPQTI
jgi:glycosidase